MITHGKIARKYMDFRLFPQHNIDLWRPLS